MSCIFAFASASRPTNSVRQIDHVSSSRGRVMYSKADDRVLPVLSAEHVI